MDITPPPTRVDTNEDLHAPIPSTRTVRSLTEKFEALNLKGEGKEQEFQLSDEQKGQVSVSEEEERKLERNLNSPSSVVNDVKNYVSFFVTLFKTREDPKTVGISNAGFWDMELTITPQNTSNVTSIAYAYYNPSHAIVNAVDRVLKEKVLPPANEYLSKYEATYFYQNNFNIRETITLSAKDMKVDFTLLHELSKVPFRIVSSGKGFRAVTDLNKKEENEKLIELGDDIVSCFIAKSFLEKHEPVPLASQTAMADTL